MLNKIVTSVGRYAAKKAGNKVLEKSFDFYDNSKRKLINNTVWVKPLNVGERETIQCLQNPRNRVEYCVSLGNHARRKYQKTGKY